MNFKKLLNSPEYRYIGLLAIGNVITVITGQAFYATITITITLALHLINRQKLVEGTEQNKKDIKSFRKFILTSTSSEETTNLNKLEQIISEIQQKNLQFEKQIKNLTTNLNNLSVEKGTIDLTQTEKLIANLNEKINNLDTEKLSNNQLKDLINYFNCNIKQQIQDFNQLLEKTRPGYELIFDRDGSRKVLLEALSIAQSRIILVCPWIAYGADDEIIESCKAFLKKGGSIYLGWGHLNDVGKDKHEFISREEFIKIIKSKKKDWAYNKLEEFIKLEEDYPNKMNLRLLGTHEKFLICDNSFAMVGSHNFLTSNLKIEEREVGLKFNDLNIIRDLIDRFENGSSLDKLKVNNRRQIPKPQKRNKRL